MAATTQAPTIADARRAADALAEAGAGQVVLFGSLARGEADDLSDIDLIAIYDDIDYRERGRIADTARTVAVDAAGFPVDVLVTDRPEWAIRTSRVHTSLEACAARTGRTLVDHPPGLVGWHKEMVMPTDDYHEAAYRLGHVAHALDKLCQHLEPGPMQALYIELGDVESAAVSELGRMLTLGGAAHSGIEHSLKALSHLTAQPQKQPWGHDIEALCQQLPPDTRREVIRVLSPVVPASVTPRHKWERYHHGGDDPDPTPRVVEQLIRAACRLADYTADRFGATDAARRVRTPLAVILDHLDMYDLNAARRSRPPDG